MDGVNIGDVCDPFLMNAYGWKILLEVIRPLSWDCFRGLMPKLPIEKSIAKPSLLAQVIVDKMANGIPLYRQSEDYKRIGAHLSRQVLSNWMMKSSQLLDVIVHKMKADLMSRDTLHADETTVQVLKETGTKATSKSYMWVFESSAHDQDIFLYHYDKSRSGAVAKAFLKDFQGYLHVDGYQRYYQVEGVKLVHCFAHLRRKFYDLVASLTEEQKQTSRSVVALDHIAKIYAADQLTRQRPLDQRLAYKQSTLKPMFMAFKDWLN